MYYVYMLRCKDNSIYTGITTDISRRIEEHLSKSDKCAKYTLNHEAVRLEKLWQTENRSLASRLEFYIKRLNKQQKEILIRDDIYFKSLLSKYIECDKYICICSDIRGMEYEKKKKE